MRLPVVACVIALAIVSRWLVLLTINFFSPGFQATRLLADILTGALAGLLLASLCNYFALTSLAELSARSAFVPAP